jgi:hypothetical protein
LDDTRHFSDVFPTPTIAQQDALDDVFSYHAPTADDQVAYNAIRETAKGLAMVITRVCPASADRTAALRKVREAVMTANASVALRGRSL